jgi:hypothetical protein
MPVVLIVLLTVLLVLLALVWRALRRARRADFIRQYTLPQGLFEKLRARHPQLTLKDCQLVAQALRQFFLAYLAGGRQPVAMPSQVVDDLWHEFILYTRNYQAFCKQAFGDFMHHTPAVAMGGEKRSNEGLRRCWWHCCRAENINPAQPTRLPLLFAIDTKLHIVGGFRYAPNCGPLRAQPGDSGGAVVIHCGGDFNDASFDGGTDGFGDGGSDGGGDGGGGDGGGCGS